MPSTCPNSFPPVFGSHFLASIILGAICSLFAFGAHAQELRGIAVQGYITVAHPPTAFDVNGEHAAITPATHYKLMGDKMKLTDIPMREPKVGDYVWVVGAFDGQAGIARAKTLIFRDALSEKLAGFSVIERMVSSGAEPVFEADGYRVRIGSTTETSFRGDLKAISDVGANTWVRYSGTRDKSGMLLVTKATFAPGRLKAAKDDVVGLAHEQMKFEAPDLANKRDGRVNLEMFGGWRTVPADRELQERVGRVGMGVVPDYQKAMAESDPFKIKFRFYGIDDDGIRSEICSSHGGLILVSRQTVERLKDDSQLAAVLADGVAFTLQHQAKRLAVDEWKEIGEVAAETAEIGFIPTIIAPFEVAGLVHEKVEMAAEERGRIALALMADAGYDPWQAPEAWRLLGPKHLPSDLNSLKYPDLSGYQLGVLSLQYNANSAAVAPYATQPLGKPTEQR